MRFSEIQIGQLYLWEHFVQPGDANPIEEVVRVVSKPGGGVSQVTFGCNSCPPLTDFNLLVEIRTKDGKRELVQAAELRAAYGVANGREAL